MKNITKIAVAAMIAFAPAALLHAYEGGKPAHRQGEVNHRLRRQNRRINQGVKKGTLTKDEAKDLRKDDRTIHQEERDMRKENGGKLTKADKKALNQQENEVSKKIYDEKHD